MNGPLDWLVSLFSKGPTQVLRVGSRVRTSQGEGVVTGGSIHYDLDKKFTNSQFRDNRTSSLHTIHVI